MLVWRAVGNLNSNLCKRGTMTSSVAFPALKIISKDQNDTWPEEKVRIKRRRGCQGLRKWWAIRWRAEFYLYTQDTGTTEDTGLHTGMIIQGPPL